MQIKTKKADNSAKVYDVYRVAGNRAEYISGAHTDLRKDKVIVTSTAGGATKISLGNRKASVNFVQTIEAGTRDAAVKELVDAKMELVSSFPAGMSDASALELIANVKEFFSQGAAELLAIVRRGVIS